MQLLGRVAARAGGATEVLSVDSSGPALARATARGARVLNGPMEVPGGQRVVQLLDPQGAAFALTTPPA